MAITGNILIAAIPNVLADGTAYTGQGASEAAGGNHIDERPAKVTAVSSMLPLASSFQGANTSSLAAIDWVGIVNHNLDRRRGSLWRAWVKVESAGAYSTFTGIEELYPTGLAASSNATGTYSDIDDNPWATSGDGITNTAAGAWTARLSFATPSATLSSVGSATAADHAVVVRAVYGLSIGGGTLTVKLYESGSLVATLLSAAKVGPSDILGRTVYICTFNTSQLGTASGADVEIQLEGSDGVAVTSLLWVAGLSVAGKDSGFLAVDAPPESSDFGGYSAAQAGEEPTQNDFHAFSTAQTFTGGQYPHVAVAFVNGTNAASPVNKLGVLAAGKAWQPSRNPLISIGVSDPSTKGKTLGGQDTGANRRRRRIATIAYEDLTREQMLELFERIDWRKGRLGRFFVCLFPSDSYGKRITSFWATLGESETPGLWEPYVATDEQDNASPLRWRRTYSLEECL